MLFVQYKFRHVDEHNTIHTLLQLITRARLTLVDDTTKWGSVKSLYNKPLWCTICSLKSAFHICTPGKLKTTTPILNILPLLENLLVSFNGRASLYFKKIRLPLGKVEETVSEEIVFWQLILSNIAIWRCCQ